MDGENKKFHPSLFNNIMCKVIPDQDRVTAHCTELSLADLALISFGRGTKYISGQINIYNRKKI